MREFRLNGWLIASALFLTISLGEFGVFNPLIARYQAHEEAARMENPYYAKVKHLDKVQEDMQRKAQSMPLGEQLDLMVQARKAGADLTKTAADNWGAKEDAPLVNYVYQDWSENFSMGHERLNQLLDKIAASGRPPIGQLKGYVALARDCTEEERSGPGYDHGKIACKQFDQAVQSPGHSRVGTLFVAGTTYASTTLD